MVDSKLFSDVYRGKKVLVTGNTGFKGSWLTTWLISLGADVYVYLKIFQVNRLCLKSFIWLTK